MAYYWASVEGQMIRWVLARDLCMYGRLIKTKRDCMCLEKMSVETAPLWSAGWTRYCSWTKVVL